MPNPEPPIFGAMPPTMVPPPIASGMPPTMFGGMPPQINPEFPGMAPPPHLINGAGYMGPNITPLPT